MTSVTVTKEQLDQAVAGQTIPTRFLAMVRDNGERVALRWRNPDETWGEWTWNDYADQVRRVAAGLGDLGLGRGQRLVIMMRNRPEFHVVDLATLLCGGTPISIYNSSSPEQVEYLASHSEATVAVVEDIGFLERFLKVREQLPNLKHIVVLDDPGGLAGPDVTPYAQLTGAEPVDLEQAVQVARADDLATVIYTSGTTGPPKGVMLTHYNIVFTAEGYMHLLEREPLGWRAVSYLPMAHIAERMTGHYLGVLGGLEVTTCPETTLLSTYLAHVRPQTFFGVPRVWEKLYSGVNAALAADSEKAQKFNEAVAAAKSIDEVRRTGAPLSDEQQQTWDFLDSAAFKPVRELIGLDQVIIAVTGAAPIPVEVLEWFRCIGVPLSEIYGMSESTGPMTWDPYRIKVGTVGRAFPGCDVKLLDDGEVVCKGGNVFTGYLKDREKTRDALDDDGWLHSGDIGELDDEGYLRIVDRKKELIITAGGKNISPANLEAALKSFPLIGQAAVIGDKRPFISALVVLDPEVAPAWAKQRGIEAATIAELAQHPDVLAEVDSNVKEANKRFSQVEQVKKFTLLTEEWLPDSDELTPTMKLKRRGVNEKYAAEIEAIYAK
jgi:long-chain acyl-CoA synthetase